MPHIPIPPTQFKGKGYTNLTGTIVASNTNGVINIAPPNSNVAQQIKNVAEQQARMVLDEWMKQYKDLFDSKSVKLTIRNIQSIVGMNYDDRLTIVGVVEEDKYYQFNLDNIARTAGYQILLHRRQTDSGHYIMEYDSKTLWLNKDELDTPEKIIICMNTI
jgi:hypothetical protein